MTHPTTQTTTQTEVRLIRRPMGMPQPDDFEFATLPIPDLQPDQVLIEATHLSLDPYMRGRMDDAKSYAAAVPLGARMEGGGVGRVIASASDKFKGGDMVFGILGWATHAVLPASTLRRLDPTRAPVTTALGVLGMPGFTGWYGLTELGRPKAGETLVVGAATGPVGSMVGQLAKLQGLRVIGIAGGPEKCALAQDTFGFDQCIDHRAHDSARDLRHAIAQAAPDGVDIYFENIAGKTLDAILPLMNTHGRIPVCGMVSWYNAGALGANTQTQGPDTLPRLWRSILVSRLSVNGFIISDHWDHYGAFLADVAPKLGHGITYHEDISQGLDQIIPAFQRMLLGQNTGKTIVQVA